MYLCIRCCPMNYTVAMPCLSSKPPFKGYLLPDTTWKDGFIPASGMRLETSDIHTLRFRASTSFAYLLTAASSPLKGTGIFCSKNACFWLGKTRYQASNTAIMYKRCVPAQAWTTYLQSVKQSPVSFLLLLEGLQDYVILVIICMISSVLSTEVSPIKLCSKRQKGNNPFTWTQAFNVVLQCLGKDVK